MKVFFTCSTKKLLENERNYLTIRKILKSKHGVTLINDWIPRAIKLRRKKERFNSKERVNIYKKVLKSVTVSDMIVIEGTVSVMSLGYQIMLALQKGKPILFLQKDSARKQDSFIQGLDSPLISHEHYNLSSIENIIDKYIKYHSIKRKVRFNLVLDILQSNYIAWKSIEKNSTRTNIIKEIIKKSAREDKQYQKFITGKSSK